MPLQSTNLVSLPVDHTGGWDWENKHVVASYERPGGDTAGISINDIIEAGTVLICAGPADLDSAANKTAGAAGGAGTSGGSTTAIAGIRIVPIGLVETVQINMNKPLSRIFEIGSQLSYLIPGRTVGGIAMNRVLFDGPSMLKMLYMGEVKSDTNTDQNVKKTQFASNNAGTDFYAPIGSGNIAMNLASAFFNQPIGLAFLFRDQNNQDVSEIYFEGCNVNTYNMGISANMNVLTESVTMEFVRCRPVNTAVGNIWIRGSAENLGNLIDMPVIGGEIKNV